MARHLDIALLRTFVAVIDRGSMTAAARALHLTQGAISQQVKRLEQQFEVVLLERRQHRLSLTLAGERLLNRARALLELNDQVWADMSPQHLSGPVRMGVPYDLLGATVATALKAFEVAWPQALVALRGGASDELLAALQAGEVDLALVEEPLGTTPDARYQVDCLNVERLVWVGAAGGNAWQKQPLPISLVAPGCSFRPAIFAALQARRRTWRSVYESGNIEATRATVRADLAISAWLAFTVPDDLQILGSAQALPELPAFAINLYQMREGSPAASRELAGAIVRAFRKTA